VMFRRMYPRLEDFLAVRREVDPDGIFNSDLARRLELSTAAVGGAA
jgi:decaprenylphospho-beta-D-ribofuranose 2-oxidase